MILKIVCLILLVSVAEFRATPTNPINSVRSKRSSESYKVTIYNDNRVTDFEGFVHTWLVLKKGNTETTFSFSSGGRCGISTASQMRNRSYSEHQDFNLSKSQYDNMIAEIEKFYNSCPTYNLLGSGKRYDRGPPLSFNCVTAASRILSAGEIYDFQGCHEPACVRNTIRKDFYYEFANSGIYLDSS